MLRTILPLSLPIMLLADPLSTTFEEESSWLQDETFVISASKIKENVKKSSASITVVDEETINKMGANTLLDVLRAVPGMGVAQSNIYVDKINVRGIQTWFSEKVLILLDGHSLNSDLLNGGATGTFTGLPLKHVKRIEIVRGPASALYGENAFTALINIITKDAEEIEGVRISANGGSFDTLGTDLLFGKKYGSFDIVADVNYRDTDGYRSYIAADSVGNSGHTAPYSRRLYTHLSLKHESGFYARANYNASEDGPRYGVAHALNHEDVSKKDAYFVELGYRHKISDALNLDSRVYRDFFQFDNRWRVFPAGYPTPDYTDGMLGYSGVDNIKSGIDLLLTFKQDEYTLLSGISYELQQIRNPWQKMNWNPLTMAPLPSVQDFSDPSTNFISEQERKFGAVYGELLYDLRDNLRLTAGVRYDHYNDLGGVFNPRLGASWEITPGNTVKLMYGEAFRAPTFAELYNKNNPALVGNPDLSPEKVRTFELNLRNTDVEETEISLTAFHSTFDDIITVSGTTYVNYDKIQTRGIEAELKRNLHRGSYIAANYTYQDPKNINTSQPLENISRHTAYMALNYRINTIFNLYTDLKYIGKQTRSASDTRPPVESSLTSNVTLLAKDWISKGAQMKLSVYNLFDERTYNSYSPYDYPLPGRSYMAEISYKF